VPADDGCGDLVPDRDDADRRVRAQLRDRARNGAADLAALLSIVEERDVLRPRNAGHHLQAVAGGRVEQVGCGNRVGANGVDPARRHCREVGGNTAGRREEVAARPGSERAVRHALHEEPRLASTNELSRTL
jgi:hypothetical protein